MLVEVRTPSSTRYTTTAIPMTTINQRQLTRTVSINGRIPNNACAKKINPKLKLERRL